LEDHVLQDTPTQLPGLAPHGLHRQVLDRWHHLQ
jgi:hypothetical protein